MEKEETLVSNKIIKIILECFCRKLNECHIILLNPSSFSIFFMNENFVSKFKTKNKKFLFNLISKLLLEKNIFYRFIFNTLYF